MINVNRCGMMGNTGGWTITADDNGIVPQMMIDDLVLTECDFIWLDIEGYEIFALRGATETIKKFKPVIFAERDSHDVTSFLAEFGYQKKGASAADSIYVAQ
jgi:hypothetical protein